MEVPSVLLFAERYEQLQVGQKIVVAQSTSRHRTHVVVEVTEIRGNYAYAKNESAFTWYLEFGTFGTPPYEGWHYRGGIGHSPIALALTALRETVCPDLPDDPAGQQEYLREHPEAKRLAENIEQKIRIAEAALR
jgi:hypothetical protein